jgi:hypothetical protein
MKTLIIILISIVIILAAIFLPIYNGGVGGCGVVEGGCWNYKLNLIEYIEYKNRPGLLKECPDEMILNKMPSTGSSKVPSSYYIKDGARREIQEYDGEWVRANCTVPVKEVY